MAGAGCPLSWEPLCSLRSWVLWDRGKQLVGFLDWKTGEQRVLSSGAGSSEGTEGLQGGDGSEGSSAQGRQKAQPFAYGMASLPALGTPGSRFNGNMWRIGMLPTGPQQLPQNLEQLQLSPGGCCEQGLG